MFSDGDEGEADKALGTEREGTEEGNGERGEKDSSRNCIGICMAISILELTYLEMFSLAEIHGRLLRPGPRSWALGLSDLQPRPQD